MEHDNTALQIPQAEKKSYQVFCTSRLCNDYRISDGALRTFLLISNILVSEGYFYGSNEWLAEHRGVEERTIRNHLEELESYGYIWREIWKSGIKTYRRVWLAEAYLRYCAENDIEDEEFKKCLREENIFPLERKINSGSSGNKIPPNTRSVSNTKEEQQTDDGVVAFSKLEKDLLKNLSAEDRKLHHEYCEAQNAKTPKSNYPGYRIWAARNMDKVKESPESRSEKNYLLALEIQKIFDALPYNDQRKMQFYMNKEIVEFNVVTYTRHVKYEDAEFEEVCRKEMKNRKLNFPQS